MTAKTQKGQGLIGFLWTYSTKRAKEEAGSSDVHTKCQLCSMLNAHPCQLLFKKCQENMQHTLQKCLKSKQVTCILILENEPPNNSQLMRGHDIHKDYARDALMFHALIDKEQQSTTVELGI